MSQPNLKRWNKEGDTYVSPRFENKESYDKCKKFLIRQTIIADFEDSAKIIKISVSPAKAKGNKEKLEHLEMI